MLHSLSVALSSIKAHIHQEGPAENEKPRIKLPAGKSSAKHLLGTIPPFSSRLLIHTQLLLVYQGRQDVNHRIRNRTHRVQTVAIFFQFVDLRYVALLRWYVCHDQECGSPKTSRVEVSRAFSTWKLFSGSHCEVCTFPTVMEEEKLERTAHSSDQSISIAASASPPRRFSGFTIQDWASLLFYSQTLCQVRRCILFS